MTEPTVETTFLERVKEQLHNLLEEVEDFLSVDSEPHPELDSGVGIEPEEDDDNE
jgi:hypothetical protein